MASKAKPRDEMRDHYDFAGGVRGKYAARYAEGSNVVVLAPDVAEVFPDSVAVNEAENAAMATTAREAPRAFLQAFRIQPEVCPAHP